MHDIPIYEGVSNVKNQYFTFVKDVTMPGIASNLK